MQFRVWNQSDISWVFFPHWNFAIKWILKTEFGFYTFQSFFWEQVWANVDVFHQNNIIYHNLMTKMMNGIGWKRRKKNTHLHRFTMINPENCTKLRCLSRICIGPIHWTIGYWPINRFRIPLIVYESFIIYRFTICLTSMRDFCEMCTTYVSMHINSMKTNKIWYYKYNRNSLSV